MVMNNNFNKLGLTQGLGDGGFRVILLSGGGRRVFRPLLCRITATNVRPDTVSFPCQGVFGGERRFRVHVYRTRRIFPRRGLLRASVNALTCSCLIVTANYGAGCFKGSKLRGRAVTLGGASRTLFGQGRVLSDFRRTRGANGGRRHEHLVAFTVMNNKTAKVRLTNTLTRVEGFILPRSCPSLGVGRVHVVLLSNSSQLLSTFSRRSSGRITSCLGGHSIRVGLGRQIVKCRGCRLTLGSKATVSAGGMF